MALIGHGTVLEILGPTGGTALGSPLAIVCQSIDPGGNKIDTPDVTDMGTAGTTRAFISALEDSGELSIKMLYKPLDTGLAGIIGVKGVATDFKFLLPSPSTWTRKFSGLVQSVDFTIPDDKPVTVTVKLKITGPVVDTTM